MLLKTHTTIDKFKLAQIIYDKFRLDINPELPSILQEYWHHEGVYAAFEVGEYWVKNVQIDVVGLRDDHWTDLGECKWGAFRSHRKLLENLDKNEAEHFCLKAGLINSA